VFLADLARWRQSLAGDLAKNNEGLDVWKLNESTQLTLDRLVFIRVCEDRGLEAEEHLRALLEEKDPYPQFIKALAPLRANYNGGLLDPDIADTLTVTPKVFKNIIRGLYTPWSPYRFDAIGVEILGSIYERALASIITLNRDRTVKVELKPEVRKAGGVYYTPQWVVDEIVRSTIDPLIARKRPAQLQNFRVLDPCGVRKFGRTSQNIRFAGKTEFTHPTGTRRRDSVRVRLHRRRAHSTSQSGSGNRVRQRGGDVRDPGRDPSRRSDLPTSRKWTDRVCRACRALVFGCRRGTCRISCLDQPIRSVAFGIPALRETHNRCLLRPLSQNREDAQRGLVGRWAL